MSRLRKFIPWLVCLGIGVICGFVLGRGHTHIFDSERDNPYRAAALDIQAADIAVEAEFAASKPDYKDDSAWVAWADRRNAAKSDKIDRIAQRLLPLKVVNDASDFFDVVSVGSPSHAESFPDWYWLRVPVTIVTKQDIGGVQFEVDSKDVTEATLTSNGFLLGDGNRIEAHQRVVVSVPVVWDIKDTVKCKIDHIEIHKPKEQ
jgi:hypothetical protein